MGFFLYTLALVFFLIPVTLRAYLGLKNGRSPLPYFQNNVVVNRIKIRKAIGVFSPILFWAFHGLFAVGSLVVDAWISALAAIVYMVVNTMLSSQIKAKGIHVIPEIAAPAQAEP